MATPFEPQPTQYRPAWLPEAAFLAGLAGFVGLGLSLDRDFPASITPGHLFGFSIVYLILFAVIALWRAIVKWLWKAFARRLALRIERIGEVCGAYIIASAVMSLLWVLEYNFTDVRAVALLNVPLAVWFAIDLSRLKTLAID